MEYSIKEYKKYNEHEIVSLYESVGWKNYTSNPQLLENAYQHSLKAYAAYINEQLVGIIRVVGDGFSVIFIQDLLVNPAYQRKGIGRTLVEKILHEYKAVYQKHLITDHTEKTIQFYQSMGFKMDTEMNCIAFSKYF